VDVVRRQSRNTTVQIGSADPTRLTSTHVRHPLGVLAQPPDQVALVVLVVERPPGRSGSAKSGPNSE
jgi:hypothetical protein